MTAAQSKFIQFVCLIAILAAGLFAVNPQGPLLLVFLAVGYLLADFGGRHIDHSVIEASRAEAYACSKTKRLVVFSSAALLVLIGVSIGFGTSYSRLKLFSLVAVSPISVFIGSFTYYLYKNLGGPSRAT